MFSGRSETSRVTWICSKKQSKHCRATVLQAGNGVLDFVPGM